ncbi:MAG: MBL fold metallo-hydrolase [Infirmifilum sp.]
MAERCIHVLKSMREARKIVVVALIGVLAAGIGLVLLLPNLLEEVLRAPSRAGGETPVAVVGEGLGLGGRQGYKPVKGCRIVVVVDNNGDCDLETAWGLSMYVDLNTTKILFDTGPDPGVLERNMMRLGIDPSKIDLVVLSHEHGDHVGGLSYIAKVNPRVKVYIPKGMSPNVKDWIRRLGLSVSEVENTTIIAEGVAVVGPLGDFVKEEALAVNVEGEGLVVLVGCSHPGVVNIVKKASQDLATKPYAVIGGFHMAGAPAEECRKVVEELLELEVEKIAPIHCSGDTMRSTLAQEHPEKYLNCHVGSIIEIQPARQEAKRGHV